MFELKIANPDVSSGTVQVSWCLDKEALKYLSDNNVKDPQVVLVIAPEGKQDVEHYSQKEVRVVVPLKDMVAFVEFKYPGANKIWGFVSIKNKKQAHGIYLTKMRGRYETDVLNYDATGWANWLSRTPPLDGSTLSVEVPEGVFAPEPAQWEKDWVNLLFREDCVDQCHFRKRRLFAYLVQPFLMSFSMLFRFIMLLLAASVGARGTSLKYLNPITYQVFDAFEMFSGGTIFIRHLPEDDKSDPPEGFKAMMSYAIRSVWLMPLMPLVSIPVILLMLFGKWHFLASVGAALGGIMLIVVAGIAVVAMLEAGAFGALSRFVNKLLTRKEPADFWYLNQDEMDLLVCDTQKEALTVSNLPSKKKTLKLRFQSLKTKVCRPFAG